MSNSTSAAQACRDDEPLKENIAFQRCSDGVESEHIFPETRSSASQPQSFTEDHDNHEAVGTACKQHKGRKRNVSFSSASCQVILIDHQTEGLEQELWYSPSDFMFFENQAWLSCQFIQESVADQGSFDDMGLILGLEKMLLCDSYLDRREALRNAVLDEHAIQSLAKEIKRRGTKEGCCESDGGTEEIGIIQLAATSERNSSWARDRAFMAALALEHDLSTCRAEEDLFFDLDM